MILYYYEFGRFGNIQKDNDIQTKKKHEKLNNGLVLLPK